KLEVETRSGFRPVDVVVGLPAGKTKTILVDLAGQLPAAARRLRLWTTFEVRWDRIALGIRRRGAIREQRLLPSSAELAWRGFSALASRAPGHPTTPDLHRVSPRPPWTTTLWGWATRYGDVKELVEARDGRLALMVGGDALYLRFDARALTPPAGGLERTLFFGSVGWDKDGDPNVIGGDRIEPLPTEARPGESSRRAAGLEGAGSIPGDWQRGWNTRWIPSDRWRDPLDSRPRESGGR
ncbi:MAG: hypothetical protein MI919_09855, partial [Holophagales bacterium]|nr:hypothetical protein [Holophagales bacterium]